MDKKEKIYAVSVWKKLKYIYICGNIRAVSDSFELLGPTTAQKLCKGKTHQMLFY